tara:strand:- start:3244 stop:3537 length:294 start_codon:yes stop_codon:yes gene_type:complete
MIVGANYKIIKGRKSALGYDSVTLVERRLSDLGKRSKHKILHEWVCFVGDNYFTMHEDELFEILLCDYELRRSGKHPSSHILGYDYNFKDVTRVDVD